jgi:hypothetical protein
VNAATVGVSGQFPRGIPHGEPLAVDVAFEVSRKAAKSQRGVICSCSAVASSGQRPGRGRPTCLPSPDSAYTWAVLHHKQRFASALEKASLDVDFEVSRKAAKPQSRQGVSSGHVRRCRRAVRDLVGADLRVCPPRILHTLGQSCITSSASRAHWRKLRLTWTSRSHAKPQSRKGVSSGHVRRWRRAVRDLVGADLRVCPPRILHTLGQSCITSSASPAH